MKPILLLSLLTVFVSATFVSCSKDDDDANNPPTSTCRIANVIYFDSTGAEDDNAIYNYTDNRLTSIQFDSDRYTFDYDGNRINQRNYFSSGSNDPEVYDRISYNSDGTISRIETFDPATNDPVFRVDLIYSGGKLNKASYYSIENGADSLIEEFAYTYTGNNITSSLYTSPAFPGASITFVYAYDSNPNYLTKQAQAFVSDPLFGLSAEHGILIPLAFSANNATSLSFGANNISFSYTTDNNQNLKDLKIDDEMFARYTFSCQ